MERPRKKIGRGGERTKRERRGKKESIDLGGSSAENCSK